jgi:hypothetical protein
MPIEIFVDHTGPMTANVADNALLWKCLPEMTLRSADQGTEGQDMPGAWRQRQGNEDRHRQEGLSR